MRFFLAIAPLLALIQSALSQSSNNPYTPVPYTQAPSYYPGAPWNFKDSQTRRRVCTVPAPKEGGNSAPNIISAFKRCGRNGKVVFEADTTYHIRSVMEITDLYNVEIDVRGTLLWSTDISYWLKNSLPMGYQNHSTAFILGGDQVHMYGKGVGTFDGNGQVWYDKYGTISNYPRRPHQITFDGLTNSVIEGMNFIQSQMWTMTLIHSSKVLLQDIYINNTNFKNNAYGNNLNTDGADTIYASDITFARFVIDNGDDNVAFKANSTNILVEDCSFYRSTGVAYGSIGQYNNQYEVLEDITVRNIAAYNNKYAAYVKTWTGVPQGTPPNGGGGGLGHLRNVSMSNFKVVDALQAFYITQCNSYSGFTGQCDTSKFKIEDLSIRRFGGTLRSDVVASIQCSGAAPCEGISIREVLFNYGDDGEGTARTYLCSNVEGPDGFECGGKPPQT